METQEHLRVMLLSHLPVGLVTVSAALKGWSDNPDKVAIKTYSLPAREVPYPAITICNPNGYDVGEYIRAVFDNFEFSCESGSDHCEKSRLLRADYPGFSNQSHSGGMVIPLSLCAKDTSNIFQSVSLQVDSILTQLSSFPFEAKQIFWDKKQEDIQDDLGVCTTRLMSLIPYYYLSGISSETLEDETLAVGPTYRRLFGPLIAGFDNHKEWEEIVDVHFGPCPYYDEDGYSIGTVSAPDDCIVRNLR